MAADDGKGTPERKDVRVSLSLTPELAEEFRRASKEKALPISVLIKTWAVDKLRQWQRERER